MQNGEQIDVKIPAGVKDGQTIRVKGRGGAGRGGAPNGDILLTVSVSPHPWKTRDGNDIRMDLPVTLKEAVLGGPVSVPTIKGRVKLTIPPGSGDGTRLRLRGRGIRDGHQFVELKVKVPPGEDAALAAFLRDWKPAHPFDPRAEMEEP
jgi:DnaJ-class molecular chaperone